MVLGPFMSNIKCINCNVNFVSEVQLKYTKNYVYYIIKTKRRAPYKNLYFVNFINVRIFLSLQINNVGHIKLVLRINWKRKTSKHYQLNWIVRLETSKLK